jgi:outer membrane PBP1 activator LpoA protein
MRPRLLRRCLAGLPACRSVLAALAFVLYGAPAALASEAAATPAAAPAPVAHVALLLPTRSAVFARHAGALRDGFLAASRARDKPPLPVREYAVSGDVADVLTAYRTAIASGARVVVGPLTRDAVTALAFGEPVPMPTLALNVPEQTGRAPENLFMLSLQVETEARQAAQFAWRDQRRRAVVISGGNPVQQRMQSAFIAEFTRLGGTILGEPIAPDPARIRPALRAEADMAFLALDHDTARAVRPYLGAIPGYATSSVHAGDRGVLAAHDLSGITFVDMPWLIEPDHPAVMVYPRREAGAAELERLYALGIDAWRIAELLLAGARDLRLDGVSGELALGPGGIITRALRAARYADGRLRLVEPAGREPAR